MITSKPKSSLKIAIGIFLILDFTASVWLFAGLIQNPESYFWIKLILSPVLLVIGIAVAYRSYKSSITVSLGNNQLIYKYPLGASGSHKIKDLSGWKEESIKQQNGEYKMLTIKLNNGKKLHLSSHENTNYQSIISYLRKKAKKLN